MANVIEEESSDDDLKEMTPNSNGSRPGRMGNIEEGKDDGMGDAMQKSLLDMINEQRKASAAMISTPSSSGNRTAS